MNKGTLVGLAFLSLACSSSDSKVGSSTDFGIGGEGGGTAGATGANGGATNGAAGTGSAAGGSASGSGTATGGDAGGPGGAMVGAGGGAGFAGVTSNGDAAMAPAGHDGGNDAGTGSQTFVHPGVWLAQADIDRVNQYKNMEPWKTAYDTLIASANADLNYTMQGPFASVVVTSNSVAGPTATALNNDASVVDLLASAWWLTGDRAYASKAISILNAWSSTLKSISGPQLQIEDGNAAYAFAKAGDVLAHTSSGWATADVAASQNMLATLFYPTLSPIGDANFGTTSMFAKMAIGIFADNRVMFDSAVDDFRTDPCASVQRPLPSGQDAEAARDQGHAGGNLGNLARVARVGWNQGVDLYREGDNRLLAAYEYYSFYNANATNVVPYAVYGRCTGFMSGTIGAGSRGLHQNVEAASVYAHYAVVKGIAQLPHTLEYLRLLNTDVFSLLPGSPPAAPASPAGVAAVASGNRQVRVSWAAVPGARGYTVMRSTNNGWPWGLVIASGTTGTSVTDTGLAASTTYYYVVSADNETSRSAWSAQASALTPFDPGWIAVKSGLGGPDETPFSPDLYFSGGANAVPSKEPVIDTTAVTNPAPNTAYIVQRSGVFAYTFSSLAAGASYKIRLHFAETFWTAAGSRKFNVIINGAPSLTSYDIFADAGAAYKATLKEFVATATSTGQIVVQYQAVVDNPTSSAVEVIRL